MIDPVKRPIQEVLFVQGMFNILLFLGAKKSYLRYLCSQSYIYHYSM